jgi:hypothetical protein
MTVGFRFSASISSACFIEFPPPNAIARLLVDLIPTRYYFRFVNATSHHFYVASHIVFKILKPPDCYRCAHSRLSNFA